MGAAAFDHRRLMAGAADPFDALTQAFGGVLARFGIRGLSAPALNRLLSRYFPGGAPAQFDAECPAPRTDEIEDMLLALLLAHRSDEREETGWLACALATACLGDNHLWQDMGLPNREALSSLLRRHFTALYNKNSGNMKWKKFFYKQLCEQAGIVVCKAPSCGVCTDYPVCFGPEEGDTPLPAVSGRAHAA